MGGEPRPYHHGDLHSALIAAGLRLARQGGVAGLGLRELTRAVGVTPNAAYRHFADRRALVLAVAREAQDLLARAMLDRMKAIAPTDDDAGRALELLRAVGLGYIRFAISEPGWFEVAIVTHDDPAAGGPPVTVADRVAPPYQLLLDALDGLVRAGVLSTHGRADAEWACWSTVHGFADLATRGPLRRQDRAVVDRLAEHVVATVVNGVLSDRSAAAAPGT